MPVRLSSPPARYSPLDPQHRRSTTSARNFLQSSAGRTLLATIILWIIAYIYSTYNFWRDPHSYFFNPSKAYEMHYTLHRRAEAQQLINLAELDRNLSSYQSSPEPVLCVGIVTVKRKKLQYLNGTVGSLLAGLSEDERSALNVRVLFADPRPKIHPDWGHPWLNLVDSWSGYNVSDETLDQLHEWKKNNKVRAKAIYDYTYLLDQCLTETSAPYVAIFEDDIMLADGWLTKTISALKDLRGQAQPWLYLRLFYTDIMLGWDKAIDTWYTNPIFGIIFSLGLTFFTALVLRIYFNRRSHHGYKTVVDVSTVMIIFCITIPAFVTLIYMIGRNSLMPHAYSGGLQRMDHKGCCTQALVFPRSQVPALSSHLLAQTPDQTDLLMEKYANKAGLARYAVTPPVAQHIGLVSSRFTKKKNSRKNWAFWFEANDPTRLRKEHDRVSQWAIWRASGDGSA